MKRPHLHWLSALIVLAACGGGGGGSDGPASLSGTVVLYATPSLLSEQEPNGSIDAAQPIGALAAGRECVLDARIEDERELDAFAFVAREPLHVEVEARPIHGDACEVGLAAFDAVEQRVQAEGSLLDGRTRLAFDVLGAFDLLVRPLANAGAYRIHVRTSRVAAPGARGVRGVRGVRPAFGSELKPGLGQAWERYFTTTLDARSGEFLLQAADGRDPAVIAAAYGATLVSRIPDGPALVRLLAVSAPGSLAPNALTPAGAQQGNGVPMDLRTTVARLRACSESPDVVWSELNLVRRISAASVGAAGGATLTPNDTYYGLQWHYPLMRLPQAWSISTGDNALIYAVIDTGETAHPDLDGRQIPGYDFILDPASADDGNGLDADPTDEGDGNGLSPSSFHGTHVAGTIGAETNNSQGVAGVTWSGKLMHLRALGIGGGTDFDIANAILYAARLPNNSGTLPAERADVINMSIGGAGASSTTSNAVSQARNAGCVLVAASGNENTQTPSYPAAYTGVIAVGAVDPNAVRAPYSNYGSWLDVVAPGGVSSDGDGNGYPDSVLSTLMDDSMQPVTPVYVFYQGTSMACPHVAGLVGLLLSVDPLLTPTQVEALMTSTATDLGSTGKDNFYGYGLVNAEQALLQASGAASGSPVLGLTPTVLAFGSSQTALSSSVVNLGGGTLDVGTLTVTTVDGAPWLSASTAGSGGASADVAQVQVTIDRSGLAEGAYSGSVLVASNGGSIALQVSMEVAAVPVFPSVDVYVLLVDAQTLETIAQDIVNPNPLEGQGFGALDFASIDLPYSMADLPPGDYLLAAGSDDDQDGFICGELDTYCGFYPTLNEPEVIAISAGNGFSGYDFAVSEPSGPVSGASVSPAAAAGAHKFKLLAPLASGPQR
jgi:serine protease